MKKHFLIQAYFIVLILLVLTGRTTYAASPWLWELTLQETGLDILNLPSAVYIDSEKERYYVVDVGNNRLVSFARNGEFISGFTAGNQLRTPYDMERSGDVLWVVEKGRNSLTRINLADKKIVPQSITYKGKAIYPDRIELANNRIFLLDKASGTVLELDLDMNVLKTFGCSNCVSGFVDFKIAEGKLWALEQQEKSVYLFSLSGQFEKNIKLDGPPLDFPRSIAIDDIGSIYILDRHAGNIAVFSSSGQFKYSFLNGGNARGQLYYPAEIKFDPWGRLCVVEEGNGRVQVFSHR